MTVASPWTDQAVAILRELKIAGKSYGEIAGTLSECFQHKFTRGSVASRLHAEREHMKKRGASVEGLLTPAPKMVPARLASVAIEQEKPRATAPPDSIAKAPKTIADEDFCRHACKWPLMARDAAGEIQMCQNATTGHVYCDEHRSYAYAGQASGDSAKSQAAAASIHIIRRSAA